MYITCLDLEGVLVPEIWIAFAEETGIPELKKTTRDEPDYNKLMKYRLDILKDGCGRGSYSRPFRGGSGNGTGGCACRRRRSPESLSRCRSSPADARRGSGRCRGCRG